MAKNRSVYAAVVLTLVVFVYLREEAMTYFALYAVLFAPLLSLILLFLSRLRFGRGKQTSLHLKRYFTLSETMRSDYVSKGEALDYILTLKNNSFLPYLHVQTSFQADSLCFDVDAAEQYISIGPSGRREIHFQLSAKYRGVYEIGVDRIWLYDFLGLFRFSQKQGRRMQITVMPDMRNVPYLPLDFMAREAEAAKTQMREESYSVVSDLRKYQPMDSFKKIHWKVSAKRNELISKNFQETERQAVILCVDNAKIRGPRQEALELEDSMMEAVVSVIAYCNQQGYSASLSAIGREDTEFSGSFDYLFRAAAHLPFDSEYHFVTCLSRISELYSDPVNLILFVQDFGGEIFSAVETLRHLGNQLILFYFTGHAEDVRIKKLQELGVTCIDFREMQAETR